MAEKLFQIKEAKNACQTVAIHNLQILDQKIKIYIKNNSGNIGMNCILNNSISVLQVLSVIIFFNSSVVDVQYYISYRYMTLIQYLYMK